MKRFVQALLIIILLIIFGVFNYNLKQTNTVIGYNSPTELIIDFNNNGVSDFGEVICIPNTASFELNINPKIPDFAKNLNKEEIIGMGYIADEFVRNKVLLKGVKMKFTGEKTPNCRYAEIYLNDVKYSDELFNSGLAQLNGKIDSDKFNEQLNKAQKLNLVLLNKKNNKYHKLDCEYGTQSSDYIIVQKKQLPQDAVKCTACHKTVKKNTPVAKKDTANTAKTFQVTDGDIKFILPDFTTHLKINRECKTEACIALINEINNAKETIDMAAYGYDEVPMITTAIKNAKDRGVKFRYVYDSTYPKENTFYKDNNILVSLADESATDFYEGQSDTTNKIMHNKFIIFDNKTVYTGSMNISPTGLSDYNANTIIIINSPKIAELYKAEFEQMLQGKFHEYKEDLDLNKQFEINGTKISIYFSPKDMTSQYILPLIYDAQNYIYVPTFIMSHKDITQALFDVQKRGVDVRIIIDANGRTANHSKYNDLRRSKVQIKTENYAGKMHSKTMIIDDKYVITGSMNFSNSGETRNDENTLIIENEALAKYYKEFFLYLWGTIPDYWLTHGAVAESLNSIGSCNDGLDNDFDGLIDEKDPGCFPKTHQ